MSGLSGKQKKAIAALLSEPTTEAAAESAGVTSRTIRRWLKQPAFRQALTQAETEAIEEAARLMAAASIQAVRTLLDIMKNEPESSERRQAAAVVLARVGPIRLLGQLENRLSELEKRNEY